MKHLIAVSQLTRSTVNSLIQNADKMKHIVNNKIVDDRLRGKTLISLYYEPSTRTMCSFQSAMLRLGGSNIFIADKFSSSEKGESLEDTIRTLNCYGDAIVMRHPVKGTSQTAAAVSNIPIINAGDGNGEHPTQSLLDIYTIYSEFGHIGGNVDYAPMRITFVGDLKNSRTIHSLIQLLLLYDNIQFIYVCPPGLEMPGDIVDKITNMGITQITNMDLHEAIGITDVLYMTRIQKERFDNIDEYNNILQSQSTTYQLSTEILVLAKPKMIIMHPLPRNNEIPTEIDSDPRAVYFKQMQYGLYMRMALLDWIICEKKQNNSNKSDMDYNGVWHY
jgi:aspartate carbamoyltransferase